MFQRRWLFDFCALLVLASWLGACESTCPKGMTASQSGLCMVPLQAGGVWRTLYQGDLQVRLPAIQTQHHAGLYGFFFVEIPQELKEEDGAKTQLGDWKLLIRREKHRTLPASLQLRWRMPYATRYLHRQETVALLARWNQASTRQHKTLVGHYQHKTETLEIQIKGFPADCTEIELIPIRYPIRLAQQFQALQKI